MTRVRSLAGVVAVTTGLLIVAGLASRDRPLSTDGWSVSDRTAEILVAVVFCVVAALTIALAVESHRPGSTARRRLGPGDVLFVLALVAAILAAAYGLGRAFHPDRSRTRYAGVPCVKYMQAHDKSTAVCRAPLEKPPVAKRARHATRADSPAPWLAAGAILVLLAAGAGVFALRRRRPSVPPTHTDDGGRSAIVAAADLSIDDLRREPDARRAIVAAYARMETALASAGLPRRRSEAPREFLVRALLDLDASAGAASRLTELFELAKFSRHATTPAMRDEAIDALIAIRDELSEPEPARHT